MNTAEMFIAANTNSKTYVTVDGAMLYSNEKGFYCLEDGESWPADAFSTVDDIMALQWEDATHKCSIETLHSLLENVFYGGTSGDPLIIRSPIADNQVALQNIVTMAISDNWGGVSDGYHTFNELYHHRALLTAALFNSNARCCWKSKLHADNTMYDDMFIVGMTTDDGEATYHYNIDPYWDMFHVPVWYNAPEWDGHTPEDAINRIYAHINKLNYGG